jgi:hypothetical protein
MANQIQGSYDISQLPLDISQESEELLQGAQVFLPYTNTLDQSDEFRARSFDNSAKLIGSEGSLGICVLSATGSFKPEMLDEPNNLKQNDGQEDIMNILSSNGALGFYSRTNNTDKNAQPKVQAWLEATGATFSNTELAKIAIAEGAVLETQGQYGRYYIDPYQS